MAGSVAIDAREVSIVYGAGEKAVVALDGITVTVAENEFVAIIGPSGCGKSSFLKAVCDLLPPDVMQGTIEVHGKPPPDARRDNAFAFVFPGSRTRTMANGARQRVSPARSRCIP